MFFLGPGNKTLFRGPCTNTIPGAPIGGGAFTNRGSGSHMSKLSATCASTVCVMVARSHGLPHDLYLKIKCTSDPLKTIRVPEIYQNPPCDTLSIPPCKIEMVAKKNIKANHAITCRRKVEYELLFGISEARVTNVTFP